MLNLTKYFVAGGAGFIGSHMVRKLLDRPDTQVVVYDNFSSGRGWHLPEDLRVPIVRQALKDREQPTRTRVETEAGRETCPWSASTRRSSAAEAGPTRGPRSKPW